MQPHAIDIYTHSAREFLAVVTPTQALSTTSKENQSEKELSFMLLNCFTCVSVLYFLELSHFQYHQCGNETAHKLNWAFF